MHAATPQKVDEEEDFGFRDAVNSLRVCMANGLFPTTVEQKVDRGGAVERRESTTSELTRVGAAGGGVKDPALDESRSVLLWLRGMSKGGAQKRLWRPLVEKMERIDCKLSQEDAAFWLYRSVVQYTPQYERVHTWTSVQLKENFNNIAQKLDEKYGLMKQLGLTGDAFLRLTTTDLAGYPLAITCPQDQRDVLLALDRIKLDKGNVKGAAVMCEEQFAHLQSETSVLDGTTPNPQAQAVRTVLRHLLRALDDLPPVPHTALVFKTMKVRGCEADIGRRNEDNFAPGMVLSWPVITSGTCDIDVVTYLNHYEANVNGDYLSRGANFTVALVPLAPKQIGGWGPDEDAQSHSPRSSMHSPRHSSPDDNEEEDPLLVKPWHIGSLLVQRVASGRRRSSVRRSFRYAGDRTPSRHSRDRRPTPPLTADVDACDIESVFTSESEWDVDDDILPSAMRDASQRHSTIPDLAHAVSEVLIPPEVEFQVHLNCYIPMANAVLVVAEELDPTIAAATASLLNPAHPALGALEHFVQNNLSQLHFTASRKRSLRVLSSESAGTSLSSPVGLRKRYSVAQLDLRCKKQACSDAMTHIAQLVKAEDMCHEVSLALMNRMKHRQTVMTWMESWHSFLCSLHLLEAMEVHARTELAQAYQGFREMAFALKDMVVAKRISEAKSCWIIQKLEDSEYSDLAATVIGIVSYQKQKANVLASSQLKGVPHHQIMRRRHHSATVLYILTLVLNVLKFAGRQAEFIQQFSMPDATQVCQIHAENEHVALVYLDIWNELGTGSEAASMMFTHDLLEQLLRHHSSTEVTMRVLSAFVKISKKLRGALAIQQPNLASWVVRRALEHVRHRALLKNAITITANIVVTPSSLTKDLIYRQGAGKLCLTVIEAVGLADVTLLRIALEAFVRMLSSLEVSWQAVTSDRGQAVIGAIVSQGNELWPEVTACDALQQKSEWVKVRSLAFRAQSLLSRIKSA
eukprot:TRINITY_DN14968_c0_g1_i1.p1 TRINITY_DN14968_c0_g1~~TRINITY_DN14968_c0_g1_i1.p1  ORF type:complete len:973 (+),score=222.15 TRINITY_DN14968_c0_g1_i1:68-2986(+)